MERKISKAKAATSWEEVGQWYSGAVGEKGHYYHEKIILPAVLRLMDLKHTTSPKILDLACGQGVLGRHLPLSVGYTGVDAAPTLIKDAKKYDKNPSHKYIAADVTKRLSLPEHSFTHVTVILALQNIAQPQLVLRNAAECLQHCGRLILVLNHPCFRIPRQSSWQVDTANKVQYRRLDRYSSPLEIPIKAHPSKAEKSPDTMSFHHSLADYSRWLYEAGFVIELLEEWHSDKVSTGGAAKMENRSRAEFPLFLALSARLCATKALKTQ